MSLDPMTALAFALQSSPGVYALLLGSGVSSSAQIPTGWDIVVDLIRKIATLQGADAGEDPEAWYVREFGEPPLYTVLLDRLARTPAERQAIIRRYIEPSEEQRAAGARLPTKAHRAIAALVARGSVKVILTTNFDHLIELALEERGVSYDVIDGVDALAGARPLVHSPCVLVKLHGDYRDARIRNTPAELDAYEPPVDAFLDRVLDEHGLIVCGWSAVWDTALRRAIERQPNRRFTTYWCVRGEASLEAKDLIAKRSAVVIAGRDAESLFVELESKVVALADLDRAHPLSVATAVAELKRYLPDPQARLRLEDLVIGEVARVVAATTPAIFPASGVVTTEEGVRRIKRYEAEIEILLNLLIVACSHSAGPQQDRLWSRALQQLAQREGIESGNTALISLRRYPALVALYGAGLAAFAAESWTTLNEIFFGRDAPDAEGRYQVPLIVGAFPYLPFSSGFQPQSVLFPTQTGRQMFTPVSDYLHAFLRPLLRTLLPSDGQYTETFDRFEFVLGALLADLSARPHGDGYVPDGFIGSHGWRHRRGDTSPLVWAATELARDGAGWSLLKAGLFGGETARFGTALALIAEQLKQRSFF